MRAAASFLLRSMLLSACGHQDTPPQAEPHGKPKEEDTRLLETSAQALQSFEPVKAVDTYLDSFHALKEDPGHAQEAHLFCRARNEEFSQCMIFDANTSDANLIGVEYVISERLYQHLSSEERTFWHPHNYEIVSGKMVAPGLPELAERALLAKKVNSYGKSFHTWNNVSQDGKTLPLGPAMLAWSFNADGELPASLVEQRDKRMNIDSAQKAEARKDLRARAHPQHGSSALSGAFPGRRAPSYVMEPK